MTSICLVTPAFNEAENLPVLYERVCAAMDEIGEDWRWVIVDDSSEDDTYAVLCELASKDSRLGALRLSRNCGSHLAIRCGLQYADSDCAAVFAADLQDPPEIIPDLLSKWREGAKVVWGEREKRADESQGYRLAAKIYHTLMRDLVGIKRLPPRGADLVLLDAAVVNALRDFREANVSLFALIAWLGFKQATIRYQKAARLHGHSGWTLAGLIKLAVDSVTAFSYKPIRAMTLLGLFIALLGFLYALWIIVAAITGSPPQGWASLMVIVLVVSGFQMLMLGVLGEYLWRALDEARSRPPFVIEASTGFPSNMTAEAPKAPKPANVKRRKAKTRAVG
jgi:dolichol-phosphate mannosyltransferase